MMRDNLEHWLVDGGLEGCLKSKDRALRCLQGRGRLRKRVWKEIRPPAGGNGTQQPWTAYRPSELPPRTIGWFVVQASASCYQNLKEIEVK